MNRDYVIISDDFCDLPAEYCKKNHLVIMPTDFSVNDIDYTNDKNAGNYLSPTDFYAKLRSEAQTKTVALAMEVVQNTMRPILEKGQDVIYITFSSGLSGTSNNGRLAKEELETEFPDAKIYVVDSLSASLGEGLFVNYAVNLKKEGKSIDELAEILERDKQKFCHYFTVDDLHFLHRGGRVSKTAAVFGSMLGIKPILHVDAEGKLIPIGKIRGRRQSLEALVNKMEAKIGTNKNDVIYISHGDCEDDAKFVADLVRKKFGVKSFIINFVGSTIGAHSGPGTVALFFVGDNRDEK